MSAVGTFISCLASVAVAAGLRGVLARFDDRRSPMWRHRVGSAAFWFVALVPLLLSMPASVIPDEQDVVWSGMLRHVLPGAFPAQRWMTQAAQAMLIVWIVWAAVCIGRLSSRIVRSLKMAAELRPVERQFASAVFANVPGPMLIGLCSPLVLLPREAHAIAPAVLQAVERHERMHAVRHDNWRLLAERLAMAMLPWCVPLGRLHEYVLAAREEICDAHALKRADEETRRAYARVLVDTLRRSRASASAGTSTMAGSFAAASRRIRAILREEPSAQPMPGRQKLSTFLLALCCTSVVLATPSLESSVETIAGVRGLSLRFEPVPGGSRGDYRVTALGGTSATAQAAPVPGNYRVTFARDAQGRWVVRTASQGTKR